MSKRFLGGVRSIAFPVIFCAFLLASAAADAQTNPCDLNNDGLVNSADVRVAFKMLHGLIQCTADIIGAGKCTMQMVTRVETASETGVCVTGNPTPPTLSVTSVAPASIQTGQSSVGTVTLTGGSAGSSGIRVALSSSSSVIQVPSSVTIPAGATSATFSIVGNYVSVATSAIVTASYSGVLATATVTVTAGTSVTLSSLSVSPGLLIIGQTATGTITLTGAAPTGGALVSLTSTNTAVTFPSTVTVPQGADTADFTLTAGTVTASTQVQLTASYDAKQSSVTLTVDPPSVTLNWVSSTSPDVSGYDVFRGTVSGGPYTQLNSSVVAGTSYQDSTVMANTTYFYVTTTVNSSNVQSVYSNQAEVDIP